MQIARMRDDEAAAIAALRALDVLDSGPESEFDALVRVASLVCGAPISVISLVDTERQWFKANIGLPGASETPRDVAFCAHAVLDDALFEIPDATRDARFMDNPLVTGSPDIRFYAGAPVRLSSGERIGTVCVIDREPRQLNDMQREVLKCLAEAASKALEGRRALREVQAAGELAARAALVMQHSADAIISVSADGLVKRWNPAAEALFGYRADDIVGHGARLLVPPDRAGEELAVGARMANGHARTYETVRLRRDGSRVDVAITAVPEFDAEGRQVGLTKFVRDVSERVRAQRDLRNILDAVPAVIGYWDSGLINRFGNRNYQEWYGLAPGTFVGKHVSEVLGQDLYLQCLPLMQAALRGEEQVFEGSIALHSGSGVRYALARYLPDMQDGRVLGFYAIVFDVSKMKEAQTQLETLNAQLGERTQQAEAASVAKSAFLANMSHEIRTPMNAILGMLSLLQKTELSDRQADYTHKTQGAARALLSLLNDILDFSKVEAGKMTLDPHPFRLDRVMGELSVILAANIGTKSIEVLFDIDPRLPPALVGDATRLRQILINLCGNAIKFTERGEVVLKLALLALRGSEVTLEIAVSDTGIGIAPENQERIFSGFSQAEASTTRRYGGTGLGLAICHRLVALMGSELRLQSEPGRGSRFSFQLTLPMVEDEAPVVRAGVQQVVQTVAQAVALEGRAKNRPCVLIVDDHPVARDVHRRMATSLGWQADEAASGESALELMSASPTRYDAVFLDWHMPGLDGWQTGQQIRAITGVGPAVLLFMVTAHGREMLAQRSESSQGLLDGFLVKPLTASMLQDAVAVARRARHAGTADTSVKADKGPAVRRLAGLRLLVAEDNENNQQVARELLEDEGAEVHISGNGQEAVAAVAAGDFDAVLMDVQMPVMDGYAATARIRGDLGRQTLPIIAMTANAMASDRVACLASGMNDHIGKPFDLDELVSLLLRFTGRTETASTAAGKGALPERLSAAREAAGAAGVDLTLAVQRMGGKVGVYARMLRAFMLDLQTQPQRLQALLEEGRLDDATRLMHTLKGIAATLGVDRVAACAGETEALLVIHAPSGDGLGAEFGRPLSMAVDAAQQPLAALLAALEAAAEAPGPADEPLDRAALVAAIERLAEALRDSDVCAVDMLVGLRERFDAAVGARLRPLDDAVSAFDFESALASCQSLLAEYRS